MMRSKRVIGRRAALGGLAGAMAASAVASAEGTYPNRPVRYINPYPAGGPTDTLRPSSPNLGSSAWWQTPANTLAYRDSEEARLAPIIRASGARVD